MTAKSPPTPATESPLEELLLEQGPSGIRENPSDPGEQFKVKAKFRTLRRVGDKIVETRYFDTGQTQVTYPVAAAAKIFS